MNETKAERLEMRWLPVIDASGRTRMEATWVADPRRRRSAGARGDARRLRRHSSSHDEGPSASRSALGTS